MSLLVLFAALPCFAEIVELPDGAMIYFEAKTHGRPILLVHGWAVSGKFWSKQMESLSKDFQVITMDLRTHGNSSMEFLKDIK